MTCEIFLLHLDLNTPISRRALVGALEDGSPSFAAIKQNAALQQFLLHFRDD